MLCTLRRGSGGFTLIELMIVIAIIAALAAVAIVAYTRHIKSGRIVTTKTFIAQIQARQAAYFQQFGEYCNASGATGGGTAWYPSLQAGQETVAKTWAPTLQGWKDLGARPEGNHVYATFFVRASTSAGGSNHGFDSSLAGSVGIPAQPSAPATPHPWWFVIAHADFDGSESSYSSGSCGAALSQTVCTLMWASSAHEEIVIQNEGK